MRLPLKYGTNNITVYKRSKDIPTIGSFHGADNIYGGGDITDYLVNFVNNLNPNNETNIDWPPYMLEDPNLLTFLDGDTPFIITKDDFRVQEMEKLTDVLLEYPL
jgi:acetylcholinesterase